MSAATALTLTPADTAHAAAQVYSVSLLATVPIAAAAVAAIVARRAPAGTRALVWRGTVVSLVVLWLAAWLPVHWTVWAVPGALASPLVALGRAQVTSAGDGWWSRGTITPGAFIVAYLVVAVSLLVPLVSGWLRAQSLTARGRAARGPMLVVLAEVGQTLGMRRRIRLLVHDGVRAPMACGIVRPAVLLPAGARKWKSEQLRAVLLHEVAHIASGDVAFAMLSRFVCALFWFHPGAWWVARRLHEDCELACDDRVLASGVRASAYVGLLVSMAGALGPRNALAVPLTGTRGLRGRLAAALDARRSRRVPGRGVLVAAVSLAFVLSVPLGIMRLAPTRAVLSALMLDARWDSRAYAVLGLAQRADSVATARVAAVLDPNPRVRAWARFALGAAAAPNR